MGKFKNKIITISVVGVFVISCIAVYNVIKQKNETALKPVTSNKSGMIAMYIEDENGEYKLGTSKEFPKEGYTLNLEKSKCDNGGILSQDENTKKISLKTSHTDACDLYFDIDCRYKTTTLANGLKVYDDTATVYNECNASEMYVFDHDSAEQISSWTAIERRDYRYIGANPNNYVEFNDETWRIIGVFTVETSSGEKKQLTKIIRDESIGTIPWDDYTDGSSTNEWSTASLRGLLNGEYYNTEGSFSYTYKASSTSTGTTITISKGLNSTARNQIEEVKWYLGGSSTYENLGASDYYSFERGTTTYQNSRTTNINQKVGLMYPSDYVYTYGYGVDEKCYTDGYNCGRGTPSAGWLFNNSIQWMQSPFGTGTSNVFYVYSTGYVYRNPVTNTFGVRPTVFLKSDVKIIDGDGSQNQPYKLG